MTSLQSILKTHAAQRPEAPCITHLASGTTHTYRDVHDTAARLSAVLAAAGVGKKDRVVFVVRNHWLYLPLLVACAARRATLVPVDPELHADELAFIVGDAAPALTVHLDGARVPGAGGPSSRTLTQLLDALEATPPGPLAESPAADVVLMIYTSGTTGTSKCVMLTSGNLVADATALARRYHIDERDRFLCVLPTHHMNAILMTGMVPLVAGAHVHLADLFGFKTAKGFWQQLAQLRVTVCSLVPSILALLLRLFPRGPGVPVPDLRFAFCGAAPLPAKTWQQFEDVFGLRVYQGYGLTETTCWATSSPFEGPRRWDSVGVPLDCCEVRVDDGRVVEVGEFLFAHNALEAPGAGDAAPPTAGTTPSGEVLVRGPIVGPGYYRNARLTRETLTPEGFFRTGDLGHFDAEGHLHITGRLKEIIIRNGTNVFSPDIDRVLCAHPSVEAAKTIGVRDELVGERVWSACVLRDGHAVDEAELRGWAQARLSRHLWPDAVVRLGYLPAGAAGKVSTRVLRKILSGELTEEILAALGSWRFKRAQPSGLEQMRASVQASVTWGRPIHFLAYWGCGRRDALADVDRAALERLRDFGDGARRVPQAPPRWTLVFTDQHARNNRIPQTRIDRYEAAIRAYAADLGLEMVRLSELWEAGGLSPADVREALRAPGFQAEWQAHPLRDRLVGQATRHVEAGGDPEAAAQYYLTACAREGRLIAERYPDSIFTTYNPPELDCLSPPLPKAYLYSYKEGTSVKPWFVDE